MITAKCLLEVGCTKNGEISAGCPYNRPDMYHTVNLLQVSCDVWLANRESAKERRLRYAQEARLRHSDAGSKG